MQLSETTEVTATMSLRDNAQSAWKLPIWNRFWTVSLLVEGRSGSDVMILNRMTDSPTRFAINVEAKES